MGELFRNQGAEVETTVPPDGSAEGISYPSGKPELVVDLKSRVIIDREPPLLLGLSLLTCTVAPSLHERSYSQEVIIRDGKGSLLAQDTYQSRFVEYGGVGLWSINALLDWLVRSDEQDITGDGAQKDYSRDFYAQVSQLAYNARVRDRILRGSSPSTSAPVTPPLAPASLAPAPLAPAPLAPAPLAPAPLAPAPLAPAPLAPAPLAPTSVPTASDPAEIP